MDENLEATPYCGESGDSANSEDDCHRVVINLEFQHERTIPGGVITGWLLKASDLMESGLNLTYSGDKPVESSLTMTLPGAKRPENEDEEDVICNVVRDRLTNDLRIESGKNYTIIAVECEKFCLVPLGKLDFDVTVTGRYRPTTGVDKEEAAVNADFTELIEVNAYFKTFLPVVYFCRDKTQIVSSFFNSLFAREGFDQCRIGGGD